MVQFSKTNQPPKRTHTRASEPSTNPKPRQNYGQRVHTDPKEVARQRLEQQLADEAELQLDEVPEGNSNNAVEVDATAPKVVGACSASLEVWEEGLFAEWMNAAVAPIVARGEPLSRQRVLFCVTHAEQLALQLCNTDETLASPAISLLVGESAKALCPDVVHSEDRWQVIWKLTKRAAMRRYRKEARLELRRARKPDIHLSSTQVRGKNGLSVRTSIVPNPQNSDWNTRAAREHLNEHVIEITDQNLKYIEQQQQQARDKEKQKQQPDGTQQEQQVQDENQLSTRTDREGDEFEDSDLPDEVLIQAAEATEQEPKQATEHTQPQVTEHTQSQVTEQDRQQVREKTPLSTRTGRADDGLDCNDLPDEDLLQAAKTTEQEICIKRQEGVIYRSIRLLCPYIPHPEQVTALRRLVFDREDLVLIAKTSFGKSTILQMFPIISGKCALVIVPLNQIEEEQAAKIDALGGRALVLNADTKKALSKEEEQHLYSNKYTHLFISPEMVLSDWFRKYLITPYFRSRLGLIAIDELHLVQQWGQSFRKEYAKLGALRFLTPDHCAWFGCSATLDPQTLSEVSKHTGFDSTVRVIRTDIDRPEIELYAVQIPDRTLGSFNALFHIVDPAFTDGQKTPQRVRKTVIFVDSKNGCFQAAEAIRRYLYLRTMCRYTEAELKKLIRVFHSRTRKRTKQKILESFASDGEGECQVIVATEALGLGVDLKVLDIYQYRLPNNLHLSVIWQRAGRAARWVGARGRFILLYEEWAIGVRDVPFLQKHKDDKAKLKAAKKLNARERLAMTSAANLDAQQKDLHQSQGQSSQSLGQDQSLQSQSQEPSSQNKGKMQKPKKQKGMTDDEKKHLAKRTSMDYHLWLFLNSPADCRRWVVNDFFGNAFDNRFAGICCDRCLGESFSITAIWKELESQDKQYQGETAKALINSIADIERALAMKYFDTADGEFSGRMYADVAGQFLPKAIQGRIAVWMSIQSYTPSIPELHEIIGPVFCLLDHELVDLQSHLRRALQDEHAVIKDTRDKAVAVASAAKRPYEPTGSTPKSASKRQASVQREVVSPTPLSSQAHVTTRETPSSTPLRARANVRHTSGMTPSQSRAIAGTRGTPPPSRPRATGSDTSSPQRTPTQRQPLTPRSVNRQSLPPSPSIPPKKSLYGSTGQSSPSGRPSRSAAMPKRFQE